jgi:hypothetical protein
MVWYLNINIKNIPLSTAPSPLTPKTDGIRNMTIERYCDQKLAVVNFACNEYFIRTNSTVNLYHTAVQIKKLKRLW